MFSAMGELKSVTFRGRGASGDDVYDLVFANGGVIMSAALDADGRMAGGILQPLGAPGVFTLGSVPTAGTEAALRRLVAGLASGSPDYDKLSPQFAEVVRRDLPMTHPMFSSMGELKSVTFRGRGANGRRRLRSGVRQRRGDNVGRARRRRQDGRRHSPTRGGAWALTAEANLLPRKRNVGFPP